MERKIYVVVMAAGSGSRFGGDVPKQFIDLNGRAVVAHSILTIKRWEPSAQIVLALNPVHRALWDKIAKDNSLNDIAVTSGGETRWESVRNAIATINPQPTDVIMVHDGARPLLTTQILDNLMVGLENHIGAIPTVAMTDSLRRIEGATSVAVDRSQYRAVQTPQAFNALALKKAYDLPYRPEFTDDASVMEAAGFDDLILVEGDVNNIKITNPHDLAIAKALIDNKQAI